MSTVELMTALAAAQAEMKNPEMDCVNPAFRDREFRYSSLKAVRNQVLPVLNKFGLSLLQPPVCTGDSAGVRNILTHKAGQTLELGECVFPLTKKDAQGAGSAITYARRYSMLAIAGVVGDPDDDGNEAVAKPDPKKKKDEPDGPPTAQDKALIDQYLAEIAKAKTTKELDKVASSLEKQSDHVKGACRKAYKEQMVAVGDK